ncbi:MAG: DUF3592 domain-containing protein [Xanthobacteraceae bacterium]|nr:DUF3592 domain-containing protein [Xanthobacteraceae bacterium]
MDGIWIVYLFLAAIPGLIAFAAIYKYFEVRRASRWPSVPGRVVVSVSEKRSVDSGGADSTDTEIRNFAKVVYEYKIATKTYRCDRVSVGENLGDFEVAETLAKYPIGKEVTVYYNPNNRAEAVLEREFPAFVWKGVAGIVLGFAAVIVGGIYGFTWLGGFIAATIPSTENAPFVTACIGFALLWTLILLGMQRASARARQWPTAPARIEKSGVRTYEKRDRSSKGTTRWRTMVRADVVYSYAVAGVTYRGDKVSIIRSSTNQDAFARKVAARYPLGAELKVHYNPDNPSESALDPRAPLGLYFFYLVPVIVLTIGYLASR